MPGFRRLRNPTPSTAGSGGGAAGCSVAFDLATHRGYDSDHPRVEGDVGKAGVAIDQCRGYEDPVRRHPAGQGRVSMTMNGAVIPILASFIVAGKSRGDTCALSRHHSERHSERVHGPQHLYLSARTSMRIIADIIEYTSNEMPKFNSISISGYHMQEAGANLVQELAYTLADGGICARRDGARHGCGQLRGRLASSLPSA